MFNSEFENYDIPEYNRPVSRPLHVKSCRKNPSVSCRNTKPAINEDDYHELGMRFLTHNTDNGAHAILIDKENGIFGYLVSVDDPKFQDSLIDLTVYDRNFNVIGDGTNIGAIGVTFKESYKDNVLSQMDSIVSDIRYSYASLYNQLKSM